MIASGVSNRVRFFFSVKFDFSGNCPPKRYTSISETIRDIDIFSLASRLDGPRKLNKLFFHIRTGRFGSNRTRKVILLDYVCSLTWVFSIKIKSYRERARCSFLQ